MGKNITDDDIIKHKKNAIKQLNNTFEVFTTVLIQNIKRKLI